MDICRCVSINETRVDKAKQTLEDLSSLDQTAKFFKILGDGTRFKIITILLEGEMCVCDIATTLNMTHSSISHQLKVLRENRVLKNRKDGKIVYYSLNDNHVKNIILQGLEHHNH
ncbi:ArsR/SmtB family transcription factor [Psychrilyobacter atlanticus]|uniref:ArsR/SmtB family transcription factor n=1 Tax=Psychrilyobacter atlanticus TaxID=271091 RepID=UPI000414F98B|nr:metalloregulator ArsR/SmtB family transcription factor [Psychrilyobacter atlanticus]